MIECTPGYFKLLILCSKFFPPSLLAHCVCHSQFHLCGSMCLICAFPSLSPLLTQFKHTQLSPMEGKVEIRKIEPHIYRTLFLSPLRYIHSSDLSYSPKTQDNISTFVIKSPLSAWEAMTKNQDVFSCKATNNMFSPLVTKEQEKPNKYHNLPVYTDSLSCCWGHFPCLYSPQQLTNL